MPYPSITSYLEAIQLPDSFKELVGIEPVLNSNNEPIIIAGGNAVVFKMQFQGKQVAIKCFTNESEERTLRYAAISDYLKINPSPYFVTFKYYETELFIDDEEYPVVLMDWVEGKTLGTSMLKAFRAKDNNFLRLQASKLLDMFLFLLHQPIAHGDLKHENILVKENGELVLVDYDGMYIPTLKGKQSIELGSKGYQHPERNASWFDDDLDNFSMLLLMLTHLYIAELPENCTPDSSGQLFTEVDFKSLGNSQINACFQFKICRQWAVYLFDVCEENSLLKSVNDFFRLAYNQTNALIIKVNKTQEINAKVNQQISEEYLEKGTAYQNGEEVPQDYGRAMEYYLMSAELGNSDSMVKIGNLFYQGFGVNKDYIEASRWFLKAVDKSNSNSMFNLGLLHYHGHGVTINFVKAKEWFQMAADYGNGFGMNGLGVLYKNGQGVLQDFNKAKDWFLKAEGKGNGKAMYNIGSLHENGNGVPQDYIKAIQYYYKSVELGNSEAMICIGTMYNYGRGVDMDFKKATEWYQKATELGNIKAMRILGSIYLNRKGNKVYSTKAFDLFRKAAELGDNTAMNLIGSLYEKGIGVIQDINMAYYWYKKSADLGNSQAMFKIGCLFRLGSGVTKDFAKALKWYEMAANLEDITALISLGDFYQNGEGVTQSYVMAIKYYSKAADLGSVRGMRKLGDFYKYGFGVPKDISLSQEWYKRIKSNKNHNNITSNIINKFLL